MSGSPVADYAAKVSPPVFLGFMWTGTILATHLLIFRLVVRYKSFGRLYLDDSFVILAWILLLTTSITWQVMSWRMYEEFDIATGKEAFSLDFLGRYEPYLHTVAAFNILFYTTIWLIKLSFLIFFKRLGSRTKGFRVWWWIVLVTTVLLCIPCIADIDWKCTVYPILKIMSYCITPEAIAFNENSFIVNCVLDSVTDLLIISIPIIMLWPVRLPWKQKLMLMGLFSVTVCAMVTAIIRVIVVYRPNQGADMSWLYFWTNLEMSISVMIACIGSFRQFFVYSQSPKISTNGDMAVPLKRLLAIPKSWRRTSDTPESQSDWQSNTSDARLAGGLEV